MRPAIALLMAAALLAGCGAGEHPRVTITISYSAFEPATVRVPRGVPVTFVLVNEDPIDHEWIIGDESLHEEHRTGTHPYHDAVATEVTVPALETVETTVTFAEAGPLRYICHLPGHEAYGMIGIVIVD